MAISVEFGPGIRFVAPSRSRNSSRESQRRRLTTSSSIIAMCAAGPPNEITPSLKKRSASCLSEVCDSLLSAVSVLAVSGSILFLPDHLTLVLHPQAPLDIAPLLGQSYQKFPRSWLNLIGSMRKGRFIETLDVVFRSTSSNHQHGK